MQIRSLIAAILLAAVPSIALAQSKPVKIGVLNDQSSVYADSQGIGSSPPGLPSRITPRSSDSPWRSSMPIIRTR